MLRLCAILLSVLALTPTTAYARGGGGGGGGFHGGGGIHGGGFHSGFHGPVRGFHSGNLRRFREANRFNHRDLHRRFARNNFQNGFGFPWGGDWWPDYQGYDGVQPVQQAQETPVQPEVIVIHADPDGHMTTADTAPADYSYVQGCKPIPNGYHCDAH